MIETIRAFLNVYITEHNVPLKQVLTERDVYQLSASLAAITASPETKEFNRIAETIYEPLGEKGLEATLYFIDDYIVNPPTTALEKDVSLALLVYNGLLHFKLRYDLPVEKILFVLNAYMNNHIVKQEDVHKMTLTNPISNPVRINAEEFIRFNGKIVLPHTDEIKEEFKKQLSNLLILKEKEIWKHYL